VARRILWGSLVLTPVAILGRFVFHLDETTLFVLAAVALVLALRSLDVASIAERIRPRTPVRAVSAW